MQSRQRRQLLRTVLGGAGAMLLGAGRGRIVAPALAQSGGGALHETALRGGLVQLGGAGGNIVLLAGASGVAMVDSGAPEHADAVTRYVSERFDGSPVETLFNTHWHLEHTGGNDRLGMTGAKIVGHENTRLWMSTEFYVDWQDRTYEPRAAVARPTDTFFSSDPQPIVVEHAGERIEYGLLREAHTDGDIYVRFPRQNVIVAGGAVTVGEYPVLDYATGGLIGGLIEATQKLIGLSDSETLIVPAAGPARTRRDLEAQREMLTTVPERMQRLARQGKSVAEMLAEGVTSDFDERWGNNAERFVSNVYDSLWGIGR